MRFGRKVFVFVLAVRNKSAIPTIQAPYFLIELLEYGHFSRL